MITARKLIITGLVQGVGFRPFIHRLAVKHRLKGYVRNIGGSEVEVWLEGSSFSIEKFVEDLYAEKPPPAIIEDIYIEEVEPKGYVEFVILRSGREAVKRSNIPPDFAICRDCLREILDPSNRRYRYAFNSCAWCGPRFSMIYKVPYDRSNTSMAKYALCEECMREYRDIDNIRRYHAQGISCPKDGPKLHLYTNDWELVDTDDPIIEAAKLIDEGYIIGIKGLGGYHIAALATSDDVVLELRRRKRRPAKPFAIMGLNTRILDKLVFIDDEARSKLESPQAPILLLPKKEDSPVSKYISPGLSHEGVFIAYTGLHYLLLMETRDKFLIMTSGNVSGEPMCTDEKCAREKLSNIVDYFLVHDREIVNRVDDSVLRRTSGKWVLLRRGRGYAPTWIRIGSDLGGTYIAFGADLNNTGAIGFEDKIVMTQHIGDLDSFNAQRELLKYIDFFIKNYRIDLEKTTVIVDKHPNYHSRRLGYEFAEKHGLMVIDVQHHYAHVLGAAYDNGIDGQVLGIAIDGVGWGDDDTVWGGEIILFNTSEHMYKRLGHIEQLPLTSDRDTIYPIRLIVGYLSSKGYSFEEIQNIIKYKLGGIDPKLIAELKVVNKLIEMKKFVKASSTGRFLDMISALLGICYYRSYEGEPAIKLEAVADKSSSEKLFEQFRITLDNNHYVLEYRELVESLLNDELGTSTLSELARSILYSYGYRLGELAYTSIKGRRIDHVVVSGGAAVNTYIIRGLEDNLREYGLKPLLPRRIPPNDEGLSFGQIIAGSLLVKEKNV